MTRPWPLFALLLLVTILCGCASAPVYVKWYGGEQLPPGQQALLKPASSVKIVSIDGDTSKAISASQAFGNTDYEIGILPGTHTVVVSYNSGTAFSTSTLSRTFVVEGGRRYLLRANVVKFPLGWNPAVVDVTDRKECWTVLADTVFGKCN